MGGLDENAEKDSCSKALLCDAYISVADLLAHSQELGSKYTMNRTEYGKQNFPV